jgi:hypothetical protein
MRVMSHVSVYNGLKKYTGLIEGREKIKLNVVQPRITDKIFLKVKENIKYLYSLRDNKTRLWIA